MMRNPQREKVSSFQDLSSEISFSGELEERPLGRFKKNRSQ
jgi:hypothetical protein